MYDCIGIYVLRSDAYIEFSGAKKKQADLNSNWQTGTKFVVSNG